MRRWINGRLACLIGIAVLSLLLAACGASDSEAQDQPTPSATSHPPTATESSGSGTPTNDVSATSQSLRVVDSTPTATPATLETQADDRRVTATATATPNPIPSNGAELRIDNQPVHRIIPGDETGRTLYAMTPDDVMRTNDGGETWTDVESHATLLDARSRIFVALNEPNVLYAGDRGGCGRGVSFTDFVRSSDAARSWSVVAANRDIEPLLAYESPEGAYLYATNCGLSVSADGGNTWQRISDLAGEEIFAVATDTAAPLEQILVVGATEGGTGRLFLLDTSDPTRPDLLGAVALFWGAAALDWHDGRIVLATATQVGVSDDGGVNWSWSRNGLEAATFSVDPLLEAIPQTELDPGRGFSFVRIDHDNPDRIWVAGIHGAFESGDGGRTWERLGDDVPVTSLAVSSFANRVFVSTANGTRIWALDEE